MTKNKLQHGTESEEAHTSPNPGPAGTVGEELRLSQQTLLSIFRAAPTGIGLVQDRVLLNVNERLCLMLGYAEEELLGQSARMLYESEDEFLRVGRVKYRQIGEQGIGTVETRWVTKDGRLLEILLSSAPLDPATKGSLVTFTALDISSRKKAAADLERSEALLRTITEAVGDAVFVKDLERRYTFVNQAMTEILGVAAEQLLGRTPEEVFEAEAAAVIEEVDIETFSGETVSAIRTLCVGGVDMTFHTVQAPLLDERGQVVAVCGIVRDVTEQRRAEEERQALTARIQQTQKLESLGILAGGIAHDFNNLLVGILGNAEIALMDLPKNTPGRSSVVDIETAAVRASELVRQILAYSGRGCLKVERADLPALVKEMAHLLEVSVSKRARVTFRFGADTPMVEADVAQLGQVVMNLLTNASDAIGERPGVITVCSGSITLADPPYSAALLGADLHRGDYAFLEVIDTGCGMPEETMARIFDPFFTTKFTGRGLGLAVVLGIVKGHGGAIEVRSEVGRGSVFRVLLPASPADAEQPADAEAEISGAWRSHGVILLVDDEEMVRNVGRRILERMGFEVVVASDGHDAIARFRADPTRVVCVVLDLAMPVMGGEECFRELRRIDPNACVVLSSGYDEREILTRFEGLGLAGFVRKPYRIKEFEAVLRRVIDA